MWQFQIRENSKILSYERSNKTETILRLNRLHSSQYIAFCTGVRFAFFRMLIVTKVISFLDALGLPARHHRVATSSILICLCQLNWQRLVSLTLYHDFHMLDPFHTPIYAKNHAVLFWIFSLDTDALPNDGDKTCGWCFSRRESHPRLIYQCTEAILSLSPPPPFSPRFPPVFFSFFDSLSFVEMCVKPYMYFLPFFVSQLYIEKRPGPRRPRVRM